MASVVVRRSSSSSSSFVVRRRSIVRRRRRRCVVVVALQFVGRSFGGGQSVAGGQRRRSSFVVPSFVVVVVPSFVVVAASSLLHCSSLVVRSVVGRQSVGFLCFRWTLFARCFRVHVRGGRGRRRRSFGRCCVVCGGGFVADRSLVGAEDDSEEGRHDGTTLLSVCQSQQQVRGRLLKTLYYRAFR